MPRLNVQAWRKVGTSQMVINLISEGAPLTFESTPPPCHLSNEVFTETQCQFMDDEVTKLLEAGLIKECQKRRLGNILPVKCVPTPEKKWRLVLDCRKGNDHISYEKVSQEESVSEQIEEGDRLISIDLKMGSITYQFIKTFASS